MTKEYLKKCANKLMFEMKESEYETLSKEFDTILEQMDIISSIKDIDKTEPMFFPFPLEKDLAEDEYIDYDTLTQDEVLVNAKRTYDDQVKVPKVVE